MESPFAEDPKHGSVPVEGGWAARGAVGERSLIPCSFRDGPSCGAPPHRC